MDQAFPTLLERIRQGDENALAELLEQYGPAIRRTVRHYLGPDLRPFLDTMDLVQSLHFRLVVGMRDNKLVINDPTSLMNLVRLVVRRRIAHYWRKIKKQPPRESRPPDDHPKGHPTAGSDPLVDLVANEELAHILGQLHPTDCRLLEMRWQGYSTAHAARELGLDPAFLRVRLQRLRKRLSQLDLP
jgi:RNA polymerase sigma-70 factor (ECF subfamily)